jgi:hypothetical protein
MRKGEILGMRGAHESVTYSLPIVGLDLGGVYDTPSRNGSNDHIRINNVVMHQIDNG